jgi:hypothetical protein
MNYPPPHAALWLILVGMRVTYVYLEDRFSLCVSIATQHYRESFHK